MDDRDLSNEGDLMDIHIPKPIRNWREFLKEIGIIVIGVSIALAGEQAVEKWREHRQYLDSREAMRSELAGNITRLRTRGEVAPCIANRIAEIGAMLDKAEMHQPFAPPSWVGEAVSSRIRYSAEGEAGRSGLFSLAEQRQFSNIYSFLHSIDLEQDRERQAWAQLQLLEGRSAVAPDMISNLRQALTEARFEDRRIKFLLGFVKGNSRPLSLALVPNLDPVSAPEAYPPCLPMNTPLAEGIRRTTYRGAE